MKKFLKVVCLICVISSLLLLPGCGRKQPVEKTISINEIFKKEDFPKSEKGKSICYYYDNGKEVSVYYSRNLKVGSIDLKKYFADQATYELEKKAGDWTKAFDRDLMLKKERAITFTDPDAFYDQIENGRVYTLVK